ncbi:hypothetical protein PQQ81_25390, partial [Paraburkholderia strydomiana]
MVRYSRLVGIAATTALTSLGAQSAQAQPSTITVAGQQFKLCAQENGKCSFLGTASVVFGAVPPDAPSTMLTSPRTFSNGVGCYVGSVSQADPAFGYNKACWMRAAAATPSPAPAPAPAPAPPPTPAPA